MIRVHVSVSAEWNSVCGLGSLKEHGCAGDFLEGSMVLVSANVELA